MSSRRFDFRPNVSEPRQKLKPASKNNSMSKAIDESKNSPPKHAGFQVLKRARSSLTQEIKHVEIVNGDVSSS